MRATLDFPLYLAAQGVLPDRPFPARLGFPGLPGILYHQSDQFVLYNTGKKKNNDDASLLKASGRNTGWCVIMREELKAHPLPSPPRRWSSPTSPFSPWSPFSPFMLPMSTLSMEPGLPGSPTSPLSPLKPGSPLGPEEPGKPWSPAERGGTRDTWPRALGSDQRSVLSGQ